MVGLITIDLIISSFLLGSCSVGKLPTIAGKDYKLSYCSVIFDGDNTAMNSKCFSNSLRPAIAEYVTGIRVPEA